MSDHRESRRGPVAIPRYCPACGWDVVAIGDQRQDPMRTGDAVLGARTVAAESKANATRAARKAGDVLPCRNDGCNKTATLKGSWGPLRCPAHEKAFNVAHRLAMKARSDAIAGPTTRRPGQRRTPAEKVAEGKASIAAKHRSVPAE
jgi:hypothetical protein